MNASIPESRTDTTFDKVARWLVLVLASFGVLLYSFGLITELDRIARDFWEDGIVLGFLYSGFTLLGVLRTFRPHLPRAFHFASALANVLIAYVLVMFWFGLFAGKIDSGAEIAPFLMTIVYVVVLRAIRIHEYFRPPSWTIVVVLMVTTLSFVIPAILARGARNLSDFDRVATIAGSIQIFMVLIWVVFLVIGFKQASKKSTRQQPEDIQDRLQP